MICGGPTAGVMRSQSSYTLGLGTVSIVKTPAKGWVVAAKLGIIGNTMTVAWMSMRKGVALASEISRE